MLRLITKHMEQEEIDFNNINNNLEIIELKLIEKNNTF